MFEICCNDPSISGYIIQHKPKPIPLTEEMDTLIKNLLWYAPNIDSVQASNNELIQDKLYSDFSFKYILDFMGMVEDRDVKWLDPNTTVDDADWEFFSNSVCSHCQKIIIVRTASLSKTNDLLRCIRNCIAHGHFALVEDCIIGFNLKKTRSHPEGLKKAIIKIKPRLLYDALKSLDSPIAKEMLIGYAFERIGYKTVLNPSLQINHTRFIRPDLLLEKDGKQFLIEIKDFRGQAFLHPKHLEDILTNTEHFSPEIERILFIDTSKVTNAVREKEKEINNFRIIDLKQVKEMLKDPPVDILSSPMF